VKRIVMDGRRSVADQDMMRRNGLAAYTRVPLAHPGGFGLKIRCDDADFHGQIFMDGSSLALGEDIMACPAAPV
jgi:hypothetical protein